MSQGSGLAEFRRFVWAWRVRRRLTRQHPDLQLGRGVEIRGVELLELGSLVTIESGALLHCGGQPWSEGHGGISIADRSYVGPRSVLFGAGGIEIGSDALLSPGVVITSHQHTFLQTGPPTRAQPLDFGAVVLEADVWVGANAVVLPGVTVGRGSVIGAGAVVTHDLPSGSVVMGVPARIVRHRSGFPLDE